MNGVDLALAITLCLFALRGFWRGFVRESFGLLALLLGLMAAMRYAELGASVLEPYLTLGVLHDPAVRAGIAFVAIFVATHGVVNLVGVLLDRNAGAGWLGGMNRIVGIVVGVGKGSALLAFVLLFLHLFPVIKTFDAQLMESRLAPPLIAVAGSVVRFGFTMESSAPGASQT